MKYCNKSSCTLLFTLIYVSYLNYIILINCTIKMLQVHLINGDHFCILFFFLNEDVFQALDFMKITNLTNV